MGLLIYPYFLVVFWYRDFFIKSVKKSFEIFIYATNLLSVGLILKTFFAPLKNEYHEGLVLFSIITGVIVKTALLLIDLAVLIALAFILVMVDIVILILPLILITNLFL